MVLSLSVVQKCLNMSDTGAHKEHIITEKEFTELFRDNRSLFVKIANSYVHDYASAEDITNETFIRLWEKREELCIGNYQSYAFRTIINTCLNHLKAQQVRINATQDLGEIMQRMQVYEIASLRGCNPDRIFTAEIEAIFKETIESLPEIVKEVFTASRFHGKTYSEIAADYGITIRQVTAHIQYALKILRSALKDYIGSH